MDSTSNIKIQIDKLLKRVQSYFPKKGEILVVFLVFYKRYCELIKYGYIEGLSEEFIENDLTSTSNESINGKHIFFTLMNFKNSLSIEIFNILKEFPSIAIDYNTPQNLENYIYKEQRNFETILFYVKKLDLDIFNISVEDFGSLFTETILSINQNQERQELNSLLIELLVSKTLHNIFIQSPKSGILPLKIASLQPNCQLYFDSASSLLTRMNLLMNGYFQFNVTPKKNQDLIIINDDHFEDQEFIKTITQNLTNLSSKGKLVVLLKPNKLKKLKFNSKILNCLMVATKIFLKDIDHLKSSSLLIFKKGWNSKKHGILISKLSNNNDILYSDIIPIIQGFESSKVISRTQNEVMINLAYTDIKSTQFKIDLNEESLYSKEPSYLIKKQFKILENELEGLKDLEELKINVIDKLAPIKNVLRNSSVIPIIQDDKKWLNLYLFLKESVESIKTKNVSIKTNFQNLTLLDTQINPNPFLNLLYSLDYHISIPQEEGQNALIVEFDYISQKKLCIEMSIYANDFPVEVYHSTLDYLTRLNRGSLELPYKKVEKNGLTKVATLKFPLNALLQVREVKRLVTIAEEHFDRRTSFTILDEINNENTIRGLNIDEIISLDKLDTITNEEILTIQKLRFQSSLEIFHKLNDELTLKRTNFNIKYPSNSHSLKLYIFSELKGYNYSFEEKDDLIYVKMKADIPLNPKDIVVFFKEFDKSKYLKYITHYLDEGDGNFEYYNFLKEAKREFDEIIQEVKVPPRLEYLIREFAFVTRKNRHSEHIKIGWKDKEVEQWCLNNLKKHPMGDTHFYNDMIMSFKNQIEIRRPQLSTLLENAIKQKMNASYEDFNIQYDKELASTSFYTNVEGILSGIRDLFEPIKERKQHQNITIDLKTHLRPKPSYSQIIITHENSFANEVADEEILFGVDLKNAKRKFEGYCYWHIESRFQKGCYRLTILGEKDAPKKIELQTKDVKGFTHILTFFKK